MAENKGYDLGDQLAGEVFAEEFLGFLVFCFKWNRVLQNKAFLERNHKAYFGRNHEQQWDCMAFLRRILS
jgi:hypothetical protein